MTSSPIENRWICLNCWWCTHLLLLFYAIYGKRLYLEKAQAYAVISLNMFTKLLNHFVLIILLQLKRSNFFKILHLNYFNNECHLPSETKPVLWIVIKLWCTAVKLTENLTVTLKFYCIITWIFIKQKTIHIFSHNSNI